MGLVRIFGKTTHYYSIQKEIKSTLISGNVCHSVQNFLSSRLLSKSLKSNLYRTIILPVVLYECETWSFRLWEELWLSVFENRMLRRIFGTKKDDLTRKLGN